MEEQIINFIKNLAETNIQITYLTFFLSSFLQVTFPPYPGDSITVLSGYITTVSSSFKLVNTVITTICGTLLGSYIVYKIGYIKGDEVLNYRWVKKFLPEKKKSKAQRMFDKYGPGAIFLSKFIPGINTIIILFSGIFKIKPRIVYISFVAAALIHNTVLVLLGRFLGHNMEYITSILASYNTLVLVVVGIIIVIAFVYYRLLSKNTTE